MFSRLLGMFLVFIVVSGNIAWAGEKLVYSITHKGRGFRIVRTEVFAIDPSTGESTLLFSDVATPIRVVGQTSDPELGFAAGGRLFAKAAHWSDGAQALYELAIDGSNSCRRIAPVARKSPFRKFFVKPDGSKTGSVEWLDRKQWLLIHETETGNLVGEIDLSSIFMDCYASSIGWLDGDDRLFFSLETGDVHVTSEESYALVGSYLMDETGDNITRFSDLPSREGYRSPELVRLLGFLPSGDMVFAVAERETDDPRRMRHSQYIVSAGGTDSVTMTDVSFSVEANLPVGIATEFAISHSGTYIAANNVLHRPGDTVHHVWLKNLVTGEEKKVYLLPTDGMAGPYARIHGWLEQ